MGMPSTLEDIVNRRIDDLFRSELPDAQLLTRAELKDIVTRLSAKVENAIKVSDPELYSLCEEFEKDRQEAQKRLEPLESEIRKLKLDLQLEADRAAELAAANSKLLARTEEQESSLRDTRRNESKARSHAEKLDSELSREKLKSNKIFNELAGLQASVMKGLVDKRMG